LMIGLLPGLICFEWLGTDTSIDCLFGFLALLLATYESRAAIIGSFVAAGVAAGSYGSGLVFIPIVLVHQWPRLRDRDTRAAVLLGVAGLAATLALPFLWWTNIQTLFVGGGRPDAGGLANRFGGLFTELFWRGSSYYYFSNGVGALRGTLMG